MKAVRMTGFGGTDVLQVADVDTPMPGPGEVLIEVTAAGIAFGDIMKRQGVFGTDIPLPSGLGQEVAGVVAGYGQGVTGMPVGTRVTALVEHGYAEYAVAPAHFAVPVPDGIDDAGAAALWIHGMTAYQTLVDAGELQPGSTVLVHAAAGGVGTLALQIAKTLGAATVIGAVGRPEKLDHVRRHRADVAVDYSERSWPQRVLDHTAGRGVDLVLDSVGGEIARQSLECLAPFGRIVTFGAASGTPGDLPAMALMNGNATVVGYSLNGWLRDRPERTVQTMRLLLTWAAQGEIEVTIGGRYPLDRVAEAHRAISDRRTVGKSVLIPRDSTSAR
ncbi:hypothetical protein BHQ18_13825 [Mycolicibacterium flavescens]|uniref:Enoyl reductase (ER) domain-containing protein n=1 Tax=Mycolicibacterium flavescens TaxID=1776 RepID=A0A1E3RIH7_MYCFV|nr:hypothetical protein BHQ18_13825 [Mycolicibacterium flavescens]